LLDKSVDINVIRSMSTGAAKPTELPYPRTLEVRDTCLCLHVQRAARALARRFDEAFRPLDLTNGQFSLLMSLNRPQPPGIGSVASLLAMDRTTLTAALKPLARRGLVTISVDKKDRRSRLLTIRPAGRALLAKAFPIWRQTHVELERHISQPEGLRAALLASASD
jgi:DNA-binding MarR family transcriptional regulator